MPFQTNQRSAARPQREHFPRASSLSPISSSAYAASSSHAFQSSVNHSPACFELQKTGWAGPRTQPRGIRIQPLPVGPKTDVAEGRGVVDDVELEVVDDAVELEGHIIQSTSLPTGIRAAAAVVGCRARSR